MKGYLIISNGLVELWKQRCMTNKISKKSELKRKVIKYFVD